MELNLMEGFLERKDVSLKLFVFYNLLITCCVIVELLNDNAVTTDLVFFLQCCTCMV